MFRLFKLQMCSMIRHLHRCSSGQFTHDCILHIVFCMLEKWFEQYGFVQFFVCRYIYHYSAKLRIQLVEKTLCSCVFVHSAWIWICSISRNLSFDSTSRCTDKEVRWKQAGLLFSQMWVLLLRFTTCSLLKCEEHYSLACLLLNNRLM